MSFAAVQKHVALLERAGLVTKQRIGRRKVVRTNGDGLRVARRLLDRYEDLWRGRIDRMTELISETEETTHDRHRVRKDPDALTMTTKAEFDASPSASGSCGPIRASSSAGGARRPIPRRSRRTTSRRQPRRVPHDRSHGRSTARLLGRRQSGPARHAIVFRDGFANDDGTPNGELPRNEAV